MSARDAGALPVNWSPGVNSWGSFYPAAGLQHRQRFILIDAPGEQIPQPGADDEALYNQRGTTEQWIKEGKAAIKWTRMGEESARNGPP